MFHNFILHNFANQKKNKWALKFKTQNIKGALKELKHYFSKVLYCKTKLKMKDKTANYTKGKAQVITWNSINLINFLLDLLSFWGGFWSKDLCGRQTIVLIGPQRLSILKIHYICTARRVGNESSFGLICIT